MMTKPGYLEPTSYEVTGDMAESWEFSPDGLTLSMKLRKNNHWAPLPPVNGREVTMDDIAYTWSRWIEVGSNRGDYLNSLDPDSPVLSMETPDSDTFVFKLAFPMPGLLGVMASPIKQSYLIPTESESEYDLASTPIGSGPYYVSDYKPSQGWTLTKNDGYYDKEGYYIQTVERPIIPEYASSLAQLRSGGIYELPRMPAEDILQTKKDEPKLNLYQTDLGGSVRFIGFGWDPSEPAKTPFRDQRVRQAFSMSWDRNLWLDVVLNVSNFEKAGLPVDVGWTTCVEPEYRGFWLDPQDTKAFGENSKYFQHNVEDAKKLMAAAGFGDGVTVDSNWPATGYGTDLGDQVQILEGMARDIGFQFNTTSPDFNTAWATEYRDSRGHYQGLLYRNFGVSGIDPVERLWKELNSGATNLIFTGFDPDGEGTYAGDPSLEDMIRKARGEQDLEDRKKAVQDIQRIMGEKLYNMRFPGQGSGFALGWPAIRNFQVYRGSQIALGGPEDLKHWWIDSTQAPLA